MTHWRVGDCIVMQIPKDELPAWLDTPGLLEIVEGHLQNDETLEEMKVTGNDMTTLILHLDIHREGEKSDRELDLEENGVPLV